MFKKKGFLKGIIAVVIIALVIIGGYFLIKSYIHPSVSEENETKVVMFQQPVYKPERPIPPEEQTRIRNEIASYDMDDTREIYVLKDKLDMMNIAFSDDTSACDNLTYYIEDCRGYHNAITMVKTQNCQGYEGEWIPFCEALTKQNKTWCNDIIEDLVLNDGCRYAYSRYLRVYQTKDESICQLTEQEELELDPKDDLPNYSPRAICIALARRD